MHLCTTLSISIGLPMLMPTAAFQCFLQLLGVMGSENWLAIWVFNGTHRLAIDKGWVGGLPF